MRTRADQRQDHAARVDQALHEIRTQQWAWLNQMGTKPHTVFVDTMTFYALASDPHVLWMNGTSFAPGDQQTILGLRLRRVLTSDTIIQVVGDLAPSPINTDLGIPADLLRSDDRPNRS